MYIYVCVCVQYMEKIIKTQSENIQVNKLLDQITFTRLFVYLMHDDLKNMNVNGS